MLRDCVVYRRRQIPLGKCRVEFRRLELAAVRIRTERVHSFRDTGIITDSKIVTLDKSWEYYCELWLPNLREKKNFIARYTSKHMSNLFGRYIGYTNINKGITDSKHNYVFHSGRHFFGSVLADEGASLYTIQKMMGHKDSRTTQRYAKFSPNAQRLALKSFDASMTKPTPEAPEEEQ